MCVDGGTFSSTSSTFSNNSAGVSGGAISIFPGSVVVVVSASMIDNHAQISGTLAATLFSVPQSSTISIELGGAVLIVSSELQVLTSNFRENTASVSGGAIAVVLGGLFLRSGCVLVGNKAEIGGAVSCQNLGGVSAAEIFLQDVSASNNSASCGGVFYSDECSFADNGGQYFANEAKTVSPYSVGDCAGGGVLAFLGRGSLSLTTTIMNGNRANGGDGGAIFLSLLDTSLRMSWVSLTLQGKPLHCVFCCSMA